MGVRCCHLTDTDLSVRGETFKVDSTGRLSPDPSSEITAMLLQLGSYEIVVDPPKKAAPKAAPKAEPEAAPKKAAAPKKKSTSKKSTSKK